mmetsp:Transcript_5360/g.12229  ORF Transcript_5360/g.12229 Transcript_5360/m.12229 type:complete len:444 (-) Transcript_5360:123-1454(-)
MAKEDTTTSSSTTTNTSTSITTEEYREQQETRRVVIRRHVTDRSLPKHDCADEEDLVALASILVDASLVDLQRLSANGGFDLRRETRFGCDGFHRGTATEAAGNERRRRRRRRIARASLGSWDSPVWEFHRPRVFGLLARLDALESLTLDRCRSFGLGDTLNATLSSLPNLKFLSVECVTRDGTSFAPSRGLGGDGGATTATRSVDDDDVDDESAVRYEDAEHPELEELHLLSYKIANENMLGVFLFEVLPRFPKLRNFRVGGNDIESFRGIAASIDRCEESSSATHRCRHPTDTRLRNLDLGEVRLPLAQRQNDPSEIAAVATMLRAYKELSSIRGAYQNSIGNLRALDPALDYAFEINRAGRVLLETKRNEEPSAATATATTTTTHRTEDIPLSVWPTVLERAWRVPEYGVFLPGEGPTGIYYLLRNAQSLQHGIRSNSNE